MTSVVELLNTWGGAWLWLMTRTLLETCALLGLVLAFWLPLRRRISAQLAHGLFCLVLLKVIIAVPVAGPLWRPLEWARQAAERLSARSLPDQGTLAATAVPESPTTVWSLPATGDVGATLTEVSSRAPLAAAPKAPPAGRGAGPRTIEAGAAAKPARVALSVPAVLMLGWAVCVVLLLVNFGRAAVRTRRLIRQAQTLPPRWLPVDLESLARSVGLRRRVRWAVDARLDSPAAGGLLHPAVIIPPDLNESLTPNQLTWVLLHELAHVRRGDLWVVVFQRVVQAIYFFNPAVHLANWIIDELREYACDDVALSACKTSRRDCGEGFLAIIERSAGHAPVAAPALGLFEGRMLIRRRLVRILDDERTIHARLSRPAALGLLALALALFLLPYGAPGSVSAGPEHDLRFSRGMKTPPNGPRRAPDEPASYRPGAVWHHQRANASSGGNGEPAVSAEGRAVVLAVAYSPDGTMLASAGDDSVVSLRDVATGQLTGRLQGHAEPVSCLAFSPDGRTLVTGSYDRTIRLWDVATRREKATLLGHTNWVFAVAFAPDGVSLASGGHDKTVRIWDVATGRETAKIAGASASVRAVAFSPNRGQRLLAFGGADQVVQVWDLSKNALHSRLVGHKGMVRALAFGPDGATLASAGEDGEVRLWDAPSFRLRLALAGHSDMVTCLAFSPSGAILATGSLDASVKLWETGSGQERASLHGHFDGVSAVAFAPEARQMATGGFDGSVRLWEPAAPIFTPEACLSYPGEPAGVAFSADGQSLRAAGTAGVVRWNVRAGWPFERAGKIEKATALAAAPDGSRYATAAPGGKVMLHRADNDERIATFEGDAATVRSLAFSADSRLLASGDQNGVVRVWDLIALRLSGSFATPGAPITCVAFSPDGTQLAVATADDRGKSAGSVTLWDVETRRQIGTLAGHERGALAVAFSPDGTTIATAGALGTIRVWDAATRSLRHSLTHSRCQSVAFSPDGRLLASAHEAGDVVLWDVLLGRQVGQLKGHRDLRCAVVFSPDGRSLATTSLDRTVKLWGLATARQTARATLKRDLTPVKAVAYSPDGRTLAVGDGPTDAPGTVALWDLTTRKLKAKFEDHERSIVAVEFSPDGMSLASGSCDGAIRIWDVASGKCRRELSEPSGLTNLAFSPDGRLLATAGEGSIVTLWDVETGREMGRLTDLRWPVYALAFSSRRQPAGHGRGHAGKSSGGHR